MAFIYRDALLPAVSTWNSWARVYGRFDKVWTKSTGTVYDQRLYFYRAHNWVESEPLKRLLNAMNISWEEFISQEIDNEIEEMWFYLDGKYIWDGSFAGDTRVLDATPLAAQLVAPTASEIAAMFNDSFNVGDTISVTTTYGGDTKRYVRSHDLPWSINDTGVVQSDGIDKEAIKRTLTSDPWYYLANSSHLEYTKDSNQFQLYDGGQIDVPAKDVQKPSNRLLGSTYVSTKASSEVEDKSLQYLGAFALMPNEMFHEIETDIKDVVSTRSTVKYDGEVLTYTYTREFTFTGAVESDPLITDMLAWYDNRKTLTLNARPVYTDVGEYREDIKYNTKDTIYKKALDGMLMYIDPATGMATRGITSNLFLDGHLRVYEASMMRRSDFVTMLGTCLQTDYKAEDASWFEIIAAILIVVAAFVAGFFTAGGSWAAISLAGPATIASALGTITLVLGVGMYMLSMFGGLSAQGLVNIIGRFAQWVGYAAMVTGIYAAIDNAGKALANRTLNEQGIKNITQDMVKDQMLKQSLLDNVGELLSQSLDSITSKLTEFVMPDTSNLLGTITDSLSTINDALSFYMDHEEEQLNKEYEQLEEENRRNEQETMSNMLKHPAANYILMEDRITSYDALSEMSRMMQGKVGGDESYMTWYSNVNSV